MHVSSSQKSLCLPYISTFGLFYKFFGEFWVHLGIIFFLKGLVKLMKIGNLEDLMLF